MRNILHGTLLAAVFGLAGCPPTPDPDVEHWLKLGDQDVVLCVNGAYSANLSSGVAEGLWTAQSNAGSGSGSETDAVTGTDGSTGQIEFELDDHVATWSSAELGDGWAPYGVDDSERAVIHARCAALETRPWWH